MKIAFMGDICPRRMADTLDRQSAEPILAPIQSVLGQADFRVANWESATTGEFTPIQKVGALIHSKPQNIGFLQAAGVQTAILANNHAGDCGPDGLLETMRHLKEAGIDPVGAGQNVEEAYQPHILRLGEETAAILAVCEHEFGYATEDRAGTAGYDHIRLTRDIRRLKGEADFVVVVAHSGNEYCPIPSPLAIQRCHDLADCGADAVIGMHPHCMQGYEEYHDSQIAYSTGNFLFGYPSSPNRAPGWYHGYIPMIELTRGEKPRMEIFPYQFARDCSAIVPFAGAEREALFEYLDRLNQPLHDPALHKFLYDGWCAHVGDLYAPGLHFNPDYRNGLIDQPLFGLIDLLRCESHHELLNNYLFNLMEGRREIAKAGTEAVLELSKIPVSIL